MAGRRRDKSRAAFQKKTGDDADVLELVWFLDNYLKPAKFVRGHAKRTGGTK